MKNIIVGTAGHVDHGKTWLIKALTGMDTDRLKEEKKRGITIENGFADFEIGDYNISIIDVPGHEKFIRNMLAGAGGIDLVLLVIGMDEGVMPQTVEHLHILSKLGIEKGILVFTKRDLVEDEDWIELVHEDAREMTAGTFLEGAPEIEVSAVDGYHIEDLRQMIIREIDETTLKNQAEELFRLPIDRVFTIAGYGTVITGTLLEGTIRVGDEVMIYPEGTVTKVRNVQVHNEDVEAAYAGQRTAINLQGLKKDDVKRGDVLARPGSLKNSMMVDIRLELFEDIDREVLNNSRVHFYCGAAEAVGKVVLLDRDVAEPGDVCYAQMRMEDPLCVKRNDRFIVRFYSPVITIGGGRILDADPAKHKRNRENVLEELTILDTGSDREIAALYVRQAGWELISDRDLAMKLRLSLTETESILKGLEKDGVIRRMPDGRLIHEDFVGYAAASSKSILEDYHEKNRISPGMGAEEFRSRLAAELRISDGKLVAGLIGFLEQDGVIRIEGKTVALADFRVEYTPEMQKIRDQLAELYASKGFEMPTVEEVLEGQKDPVNVRHILDAMAQDGQLVRLDHTYYMDGGCFRRALDIVRKTIAEKGSITLAEFRDSVGTTRKFAMAILAYMDNERITRLVGDERILG